MGVAVDQVKIEEENSIAETWKRRAKLFRRAYYEAELQSMDALKGRIESDLKILALERRISELEAELGQNLLTRVQG